MSMSVTSAEAGLIAAPWQAAEQDAALEQAAKNFYDQTKDLTQHGKKDHPTDRIVLGDVAATLALELGAQDPAHRAGSISEYVKLPGSGDGFQITVDANGSETLNRTPDGPGGATSLPGGDAVIAKYAAIVGHTPSQDEMAGFLAAAVAGGGMPAGTDPATAQLTVTGQDGSVLATGTASQLLSEWSALLAANEEVTPTIILAASSGPGNDSTNAPGEPQQQAQILNGTEGAAFLLGLAIQAGATTGAMVAGYNSTVAYFDQIDQPMLAVAVHYEQAAEAAQQAGNANGAELDETAAKLALQIAAEPEDARGSLSQKLDVGGHQMLVTVNQTTTDITGGAQFHHDDPSGILGIVEEVVGTVADVLSFVPVVDAIAIPVAIAVGAAEGGQDLASGNILGGVLALAGSAAGGMGKYASVVADAIGDTAADVTSVAQDVSRGVAAAQGVMGAVSGAENGDPLAVLTSIAGGVAGSVGAGTDWGRGLAVGSALTGAGVAAAGGNWASALAATETAAAGAGLFNSFGDSSAPSAASDSQAPPADWQSAAPQPVQQEDLPPLAAAAAADAAPGDAEATTPASLAAASSTASAQADMAATVGQAANTSPADPGAPDGPNGSSQQQADAQQAAQQQAAQRAGATMAAQAGAAQTNTDSLPLPVPPIPPAVVPLSPAAQADADAIMAGMGQSAGNPSPAGQVLAQNAPPGTASDAPAPVLANAAPAAAPTSDPGLTSASQPGDATSFENVSSSGQTGPGSPGFVPNDPPIKPVYPIEEGLGLLLGGGAVAWKLLTLAARQFIPSPTTLTTPPPQPSLPEIPSPLTENTLPALQETPPPLTQDPPRPPPLPPPPLETPAPLTDDAPVSNTPPTSVLDTSPASTTGTPTTATRLPQDVAVDPIGPDTLALDRPVGLSPTQNAQVQADIAQAQAEGATDFRVNQQQVDASGNRVGINRPDLQYTDANGNRIYVEYDAPSSTRGPGHETRILANDPNGTVILKRVK